jgi:hypothetical protein
LRLEKLTPRSRDKTTVDALGFAKPDRANAVMADEKQSRSGPFLLPPALCFLLPETSKTVDFIDPPYEFVLEGGVRLGHPLLGNAF